MPFPIYVKIWCRFTAFFSTNQKWYFMSQMLQAPIKQNLVKYLKISSTNLKTRPFYCKSTSIVGTILHLIKYVLQQNLWNHFKLQKIFKMPKHITFPTCLSSTRSIQIVHVPLFSCYIEIVASQFSFLSFFAIQKITLLLKWSVFGSGNVSYQF